MSSLLFILRWGLLVKEISCSLVGGVDFLPIDWFLIIELSNWISALYIFWNSVKVVLTIDVIAELTVDITTKLIAAAIAC